MKCTPRRRTGHPAEVEGGDDVVVPQPRADLGLSAEDPDTTEETEFAALFESVAGPRPHADLELEPVLEGAPEPSPEEAAAPVLAADADPALTPTLIEFDPGYADWDLVQRVTGILRDGGVVALPTDTRFALACWLEHPKAVRRMAEIKGAARNKKFSLLVSRLFFKVVFGNKFYNSCNKINQESNLKLPK